MLYLRKSSNNFAMSAARTATGHTRFPIKFESFSCSESISSGNSLSLTVPYMESLNIAIGDIVQWDNSHFAGLIMSKDIDKQSKLVSFQGLSLLGLLNNWPIEYGSSSLSMFFYSGSSHTQEKTRDIVCYFNNRRPLYGYAFSITESQYISSSWFENHYDNLSSGQYRIDLDIAAGTTVFGVLQSYFSACGQKPIFSFDASNQKIKIDLQNSAYNTYAVQKKDAITYSDSMAYTAILDKGMMHYIGLDGKPASVAVSSETLPSVMKYTGLNSYIKWSPNDSSNVTNQKELLRLREDKTLCTSFEVPKDWDLQGIALGDWLKFTDDELDIETAYMRVNEETISVDSFGTVTKKINIG